jgi:3-oxoacyl-[acyl-carrier protein] reductase
MAGDRFVELANSSLGRVMVKRAGLPAPPRLSRYEEGQPLVSGPVLVGAGDGGRMLEPVTALLGRTGADVRTQASGGAEAPFAALVFDASGVASSEELIRVYEFFHPVARRLASSGRVVIVGTAPEDCGDAREATAQRALEGFMRSLAKEVNPGSTAQLVYVAPGAEEAAESTLRFLLSSRSAYVSGQVIRVSAPAPGDAEAPADWDRPLDGKVAVVTGSARGIGEAIAQTFARDGAHVVCLDVPVQGATLSDVANAAGGEALQLDITDAEAPARLVEHVRSRHGGVDIVVHNAGITRDKTVARMSEDQWTMVLEINLTSQERITDALLREEVLRPGGRIVSVSSLGGISGNRGQTNYAASKAGVIGMVQALASAARARTATINAVAPGFIETDMTAAMPMFTREAGRRMNSMVQGGRAVDVAETIAWLASPGSGGVNGEVVRVCGQSMLGA